MTRAQPKPRRTVLSEVDQRIRAATRVALFLDFDVFLFIVEDPATFRVRETLARIAQQDGVITTVMAGGP